MPSKTEKQTIWNRFFVQLLIVEAFLQLGGFVSRPIVTNFAVELGASLSLAGFIVGLATLGAMILRPVSGLVSDRVSKKWLLVISAAAFTASSFGIAVSTTPFMIGAFNTLQGVALAFKSVSVASLAAMASPQSRIGSAIGLVGLMNTMAMAVAPATGIFISDLFGYSTCFFVGAALCGAGLVLSLFYKAAPSATIDGKQRAKQNAESTGSGSRLARLIKEAFYLPVIPYTIIILFTMWSHATLASMIAIITDMGYLESSTVYFIVFAICALASRPFAGRLSDSVGVAGVAIPGLVLAGISLALLAFFHSVAFVAIAGVGMGVGQSAARSALEAESVRGVDPGHLGRASNTFYIGMDVGTAVSPIVSGVILQVSTPQMLFASLALSCAIAAVILFFVNLKRGRKRA